MFHIDTCLLAYSSHHLSGGGDSAQNLCRKNTWIPVSQWLQDNQKCLVEEGEAGVSPRAPAPPSASNSEKAPVVKAKATHVIMSSLITSKPLRPGNRVGEWRGRAEFLQPPACRSLSSPATPGQPGCSGGTSAEAALRWEAYLALSDVPRSGALPPLSAPALFPLCVSVASGKLSQLGRLCPLHEAGSGRQ